MMYGYDMAWGGWLVMSVFAVLLVVSVAFLVRLAVRDDAGPSRARSLLDERFASGEISAEEYQSKRRLVA